MALGFTDLTSTQRVPDKGFTKSSTPRVHRISFGDGYEQRAVNGINNLEEDYRLTFRNRTKEEIDDIIAFLDNKAGVTPFNFTIPDSNVGGTSERTIKVVCDTYSQTYEYDDFYTCTATFRRVYEA